MSECTAYAYDAAGRMTQVTDPNGGVTAYEYDRNGNCTGITDAEGNRRRSRTGSRFRLGGMLKSAVLGGLTNGLMSTAVYGMDRAVGAVAGSVVTGRRSTRQRINTSGGENAKPDFYVASDGTVISAGRVKTNSQYDRLEVEMYSGKSVRPNNATDDWDNFLTLNQTDINPFIGQRSPDRIWSADGTRSIRFGDHEMSGMGTKNFHYHKESWYDD